MTGGKHPPSQSLPWWREAFGFTTVSCLSHTLNSHVRSCTHSSAFTHLQSLMRVNIIPLHLRNFHHPIHTITYLRQPCLEECLLIFQLSSGNCFTEVTSTSVNSVPALPFPTTSRRHEADGSNRFQGELQNSPYTCEYWLSNLCLARKPELMNCPRSVNLNHNALHVPRCLNANARSSEQIIYFAQNQTALLLAASCI